jgi:chlorite dismutase
MASPLLVSFVGGDVGPWTVDRITAIAGDGLPPAARLSMVDARSAPSGAWTLRGTTSNDRYTANTERTTLRAVQEGLGRPGASLAALIPITKSAAWWDLAQDERRGILEDRSRHIAIGLEYLPAVARRLHHCRDLGEDFDFLTWFEFPPEALADFDELLARLRATEEWTYVEREVEIRVSRIG